MDGFYFFNRELLKGGSRKRYRQVVQPCLLHSCEGWSWNKEMVDTLHRWESRNLVTKRSGRQRWWDSCKGWESFVKAAEELCKIALKRDENKVAQCWDRNDEQDGKNKKEKERKNATPIWL